MEHRPLPEDVERVKTKSGREVIKRKNQKIATVEELRVEGQEKAKAYVASLGKVKFIQ